MNLKIIAENEFKLLTICKSCFAKTTTTERDSNRWTLSRWLNALPIAPPGHPYLSKYILLIDVYAEKQTNVVFVYILYWQILTLDSCLIAPKRTYNTTTSLRSRSANILTTWKQYLRLREQGSEWNVFQTNSYDLVEAYICLYYI